NDDNAIRVGHEGSGNEPNWIEIDHNLIQMLDGGRRGAGSDNVTLYGHHRVYLHHNNFRHNNGNAKAENLIDVKPPRNTTGDANYCELMYNWFAGSETNHATCILQGDGRDRMHTWFNWWEGNNPLTFGDGEGNQHLDFRWNIIPDLTTGRNNDFRFWNIRDNLGSIFYGNWVKNGQLTHPSSRASTKLEFSGNYFDGTNMQLGSGATIRGQNNVKQNVSGSGWGNLGAGEGDFFAPDDFEVLASTSDPDPY
ncbi:MAG: hypothetical protein R3330_14290, partial [Saprospiraceae bacterium]|nr:hypothetical protein [Saprospiraceae bacterium]